MIALRKFFLCIQLFCIADFQVFSQIRYFEGSVIYSNRKFDETGAPAELPVDKEEYFFSKNDIYRKVISGPQLLMFGSTDIYLNSEKKVRYAIEHKNAIIRILDTPSDVEQIVPIEEKNIGEEIVNGFNCDINYLKYVHRYEGPYGPATDTLSCTYYNSKELKILHLDIFSQLQGNRNSLFLDGRYNGVPLKVILKKQNGSTIVIESLEIKEMNVDENIRLPNYHFLK